MLYGAGPGAPGPVRRKLAAANPATYLPDVAMTLGNLGILHSEQSRMEEARKVYEEALAIRRELARQYLETNQYAGPAPVPAAQYEDLVRQQKQKDGWLTKEALMQAFKGMVLTESILTEQNVLEPAEIG